MRPMYEMLQAASGRTSLHMPGHKGRSPFGLADPYALDTTELPVTDDLYAPEQGIAAAQRLYARAAGAASTLFLHGGSTAGIETMLLCSARPGDKVIIPRNAHISAVNGCILGGLEPVYAPCTLRADGYAAVREETFLQTIADNPDARAILVTRPDFYGCMLPLKRIAEAAHACGMRLLVDEAHGAHLPFMNAKLGAGNWADMWVQSTHKTLPCLTGAAVLHLADPAAENRARRMLRLVQTSSPSFLLLMAIDDARAFMEESGIQRLAQISRLADEIRRRWGDPRIAWAEEGWQLDPTRLVLADPRGGGWLAEQLAARGIDVEMHDDHRVVCILSVMDDDKTLTQLADALEQLETPQWIGGQTAGNLLPMGEQAMLPRKAAMSPVAMVPLERAAGRIVSSSVGLYPPGIPLAAPGERLTMEVIEILKTAQAQSRLGIVDGCCACVEES